MALLCGPFLALLFTTLRLLSTRFCTKSGTFPIVVTLVLFIKLLILIVSIIFSYRSNSLLFAAAKCPSILVQSVFLQSTSICYCFCGYNALYGSRHLKHYDAQYRLCASVIRSLRSCSHPDCDCELMIRTISCD